VADEKRADAIPPPEAYSHSIITMALYALPLLGFIRFTPLNTVTNTVSGRMLSVHAGFRAMTEN